MLQVIEFLKIEKFFRKSCKYRASTKILESRLLSLTKSVKRGLYRYLTNLTICNCLFQVHKWLIKDDFYYFDLFWILNISREQHRIFSLYSGGGDESFTVNKFQVSHIQRQKCKSFLCQFIFLCVKLNSFFLFYR